MCACMCVLCNRDVRASLHVCVCVSLFVKKGVSGFGRACESLVNVCVYGHASRTFLTNKGSCA